MISGAGNCTPRQRMIQKDIAKVPGGRRWGRVARSRSANRSSDSQTLSQAARARRQFRRLDSEVRALRSPGTRRSDLRSDKPGNNSSLNTTPITQIGRDEAKTAQKKRKGNFFFCTVSTLAHRNSGALLMTVSPRCLTRRRSSTAPGFARRRATCGPPWPAGEWHCRSTPAPEMPGAFRRLHFVPIGASSTADKHSVAGLTHQGRNCHGAVISFVVRECRSAGD